MRMLPDMSRKTDFRRKALSPNATGAVLWGYPTVWLMEHSTGFWRSAVLPKLEERAALSTWKAILSSGLAKEKNRAAGEDEQQLQYRPNADAYPAGIPLRVQEIKASRNFRPKSIDTGEFLRWDYSSRGG